MENLKLVVLGDGVVGKTCLLHTCSTGSYPSPPPNHPTVFDNYSANIMHGGRSINVGLWDTAGMEDYDRLRPLCYPQTDVCLICFSVDSVSSFCNVASKWRPEMEHYMPDTPCVLVACKNDLRGTTTREVVSSTEAHEYAQRAGWGYAETSALTQDGLNECFETAIEAVCNPKPNRKKKSKGLFSRSEKKGLPLPPPMPPAGKAPSIQIETSEFADHWRHLVEDPVHADIMFVVGGRHRIRAHKLVLASASAFFAKVLSIVDTSKNQLKRLESGLYYTREELNEGRVAGIQAVREERCVEDKSTLHTVIELSEDITDSTFVCVLRFLYTGLPGIEGYVPEEDLYNLINVSRIFQLPKLETICVNQLNGEELLNPNIGAHLNDETGQEIKKLFLNKDRLSDVVFNVEGEKIFAHRVVLTARSKVMAAMFGGNFAEGSQEVAEIPMHGTTAEIFLVLLEYLYTDHAPVEESDAVGVMVLADLYDQSRLVNLCELYITNEVDRSVTNNIQKSDVDVIGLLLTSQLHNADQLAGWCRHFISTNYIAFKERPEFPQLKNDNLEYVEENRWPPTSYLEEVKQYETLLAKQDSKCVVM